MIVVYTGARLRPRAQEHVSEMIRISLSNQKYESDTFVIANTYQRAGQINVRCSAREPDGPELRLCELDMPINGMDDESFDKITGEIEAAG